MKQMRINNQKKSGRWRGGFSLIEVLIAAGMFAVGMIGIVALFPTALIESQNAKENATAATVGQNALEYIRGRGFVPNPGMDGKFCVYTATDLPNNPTRWAQTYIATDDYSWINQQTDYKGKRGTPTFYNAASFLHKYSPTMQSTQDFGGAEHNLVQPFLLSPSELLYWPTGPNIVNAQPNKRLNLFPGEAPGTLVAYDTDDVPNPILPSSIDKPEDFAVRNFVDAFQSPAVAWTFGYYKKDRSTPTQLYVFVYKPTGIDLDDLDTDDSISAIQNNPAGNLYNAKAFEYDPIRGSRYNEIVSVDNFPTFMYENLRYYPMHFTLLRTDTNKILGKSVSTDKLKDENGDNNSPLRLLKKGQILLNPKTGTILTILKTLPASDWVDYLDDSKTVLYDNFRKMLSKDDFKKLIESDLIAGGFNQYIGFPLGSRDNFGNDVKPLGIFVGTLED